MGDHMLSTDAKNTVSLVPTISARLGEAIERFQLLWGSLNARPKANGWYMIIAD